MTAITRERLDRIEASHKQGTDTGQAHFPICIRCEAIWPCETVTMAAALRRVLDVRDKGAARCYSPQVARFVDDLDAALAGTQTEAADS